MGRYNHPRTQAAEHEQGHQQQQTTFQAASTASESTSSASSTRRANPPRRARKAQSATAAQATALQSPDRSPLRSAAASASHAVEWSSQETRLAHHAVSPSAVAARHAPSLSTTATNGLAAMQQGQHHPPLAPSSSSNAARAPMPSLSAADTGSDTVQTATATEPTQSEQSTASGARARDLDPSTAALVAALGPIPSGWSLASGEPTHTFDKAAFSGSDLPEDLDALARARCAAFLEDPRVLRITENEPSVNGLPRLSACVCPICGTIVKDNWVPSRSGGFRRQIRTESLKEHLGMRHHLLRRVKCPVQEWSGCQCKGYCKAHRLLNHFSDNVACLAHVARLLAARDSSGPVLSTAQWALGSDWPRAFDELVSAAMRSTGRSTIDEATQFDRVRQLVISRVAKARKVSEEAVEQGIAAHMRQAQGPLAAPPRPPLQGGKPRSAAGPSDSAVASPMMTAFPFPASPPALVTQQPHRSSTLDSLLAPPAAAHPATNQSRSPRLVVTPAPSTLGDALFDQFQLQPNLPMSPISDGASNWSQGTSVSASTGAAIDTLPPHAPFSSATLSMDFFADMVGLQQQPHTDALDHSLGLLSSIPFHTSLDPTSQLDALLPSAGLTNPVGLDAAHALFGFSHPAMPASVMATSTAQLTSPQQPAMLAPPSNPHTPVQSPRQPATPAPVMLQVPDWVQACIPASVSPVASPYASPQVYAAVSPTVPPMMASPGLVPTGLTPLMGQQLRLQGSPATSPSMVPTQVAQWTPVSAMQSPLIHAMTPLPVSSAYATQPNTTGFHQGHIPSATHVPRTRVLHFVPTPDNLLVDGVYVGPVGPSAAAAAAAASHEPGWSTMAMGFTTVADALDMHARE